MIHVWSCATRSTPNVLNKLALPNSIYLPTYLQAAS